MTATESVCCFTMFYLPISSQMGQFMYSAKAFDMLERLDPTPDYWEGKRGACVGIFQLVIAGQEPRECLSEVVQMLQRTQQPQAELIVRAIGKWVRDSRITSPPQ